MWPDDLASLSDGFEVFVSLILTVNDGSDACLAEGAMPVAMFAVALCCMDGVVAAEGGENGRSS